MELRFREHETFPPDVAAPLDQTVTVKDRKAVRRSFPFLCSRRIHRLLSSSMSSTPSSKTVPTGTRAPRNSIDNRGTDMPTIGLSRDAAQHDGKIAPRQALLA